MKRSFMRVSIIGAAITIVLGCAATIVRADGDLSKVKHIVVVMQENHSFDNYLGALPYVKGTPYHAGPCDEKDHSCVDGLACTVGAGGAITCSNANLDDDGSLVAAFHETKYCVGPDLDHSWQGSHAEGNFIFPNKMIKKSPNDGFVRQNDMTEQIDTAENATEDDTMGFYTSADLSFYYNLAQNFAIRDRHFSSVVGPTFPNRSYALAATSFGHLDTAEIFPPGTGYQPVTGSIFDLLDKAGVNWVNYYSDAPTSGIFRAVPSAHLKPAINPASPGTGDLLGDAAAGTLPPVAWVDPYFGASPLSLPFENDEHPPTDILNGQFFVSTIVSAIRNSPAWKDTVIFVTYDEHGGFYDHVKPPRARQGDENRSPDGIDPGLCEDLSNPPASLIPGGGAECAFSMADAAALCPTFSPLEPYPEFCANFDHLGFRVPFIAVSPFAKPQYVSHNTSDHTSILALIEKRFLAGRHDDEEHRPHLTERDRHADTMQDMFDFDKAPSLATVIASAPPPSASDPGCPFKP